jgi:hypothetical protein
MQLSHRPNKILVTGKSGSGKSTYFTRYLCHARYDFKFVFDGEGEFSERTGLPAAYDPDQLLDQLECRRWVIFDPVELFPGQTPAGFNFFCDWSFSLSQQLPGQKLFGCDELQKWTGTNALPQELGLVVDTGRRYGLDFAAVSQRPNRIHNSVRDALSECVAFAHQDSNALEFLLDVGFDEEELRTLQPGEFIARNLNSGVHDRGRVF